MKIVPISEYWHQIIATRSEAYLGLIYRVPPRLWRSLSLVQDKLKASDSSQLYAHPSTFHVTIKGLGYLERTMGNLQYEKAMKKISQIISGFKPFQISIRGVSAFPTSVFAMVQDPENKLQEMNVKILQELGGQVEKSEFDGPNYIPHVTLATFNNKNVDGLFSTLELEEIKHHDFGECSVYEVEAVEVNLLLALGPQETQDSAFAYVRSFHLG